MKFDNSDTRVRIAKGAVGPFYEYTMPRAMAETYMEWRTKHGSKAERGMPCRDFLANIVNTEFGIRGTCASLVVE